MLLEGIGFTVANVDDAPLYLRPFVLDQSILTTDTLLERISIHYVNCALRQTYKVVGSLEAIGNPYGLVMDVIQGTQELGSAFVEGIVEGPLLYKDILKNGHRSMQSHIIHGMLRTFSRLAGTVARGVSYASFDADYVKRNERVDARQPSNMKEGIFQGGRALVSGIYEGATDVLVHTFKERGGVRKAIGFAKGLLSIPTKPITGAMEFIAKVAAGFSNSRYLQHRRMRQEIHV
jgi:vacuolar protein sorting-associated protein 13A/C